MTKRDPFSLSGYRTGDGPRMGRNTRWWGALIGALGSLAGGALASKSAGDIADAQGAASQQQIDLARDIFDYSVGVNQPAIDARDQALAAALGMAGLPGAATGAGGRPAASANPLAPGARGVDWQGYLDQNPDVLAAYYRTQGVNNPGRTSSVDGLNIGSVSHQLGDQIWGAKGGPKVDAAWVGKSPEDFAKYHYETFGSQEGWLYDQASGQFYRRGNTPPSASAPQGGSIPNGSAIYTNPDGTARPGTNGAPMPQMAPGAGTGALSIEDQLKATPGFQFRLGQGQDALDAAFAAKGGIGSGARLKAASEYNQNFASNEYNNQFNRLMQIISPGSAAVGNAQTAATNYGTMAGGAVQGQANANAYSSAYGANAWGNAIGGAAEALGEIDWSKIFKGSKTP
jgi:hypothetical protein